MICSYRPSRWLALSPLALVLASAAFTFAAPADSSKVIIRTGYSPSAGLMSNSPAPAQPPTKTGSKTSSLSYTKKSTNEAVKPGPLAPMLNFVPRNGWKEGIVGTVFWVGEQPTENNPVPNCKSSWDTQWMENFGGYDDPDISNRTAGYRPVNFVPKQNPFYIALPYNDVLNHAITKAEASRVIPWFKQTFKRHGKSVCHNRWIAIRHEGRVAYAQWSDCGPFVTDDAPYVFGTAAPTNTSNNGAGIDLSPAVRDYLGFVSGKCVDWCFVEHSEVPDGPWKALGTNNPFSKTWVKDPEPIFAGAFVPKVKVASASSGRSKNSRKTSNGIPGFTLKKARKSES